MPDFPPTAELLFRSGSPASAGAHPEPIRPSCLRSRDRRAMGPPPCPELACTLAGGRDPACGSPSPPPVCPSLCWGCCGGATSRTGMEGQELRSIRENKHFSLLGSSDFGLINGLGHRGQSHRPFMAHQGDLGAMQRPSVDRTAGLLSPWAPGGTTSPLGAQFFQCSGRLTGPAARGFG